MGESLLGVASGLGGVVVFLPGQSWRGSGLGWSKGDRPGRLFVLITVTGFQGGGVGDYRDQMAMYLGIWLSILKPTFKHNTVII